MTGLHGADNMTMPREVGVLTGLSVGTDPLYFGQLVTGVCAERMGDETVCWPRVHQLLEGIMARWERKADRTGLPGIHDFHWDTPRKLADDQAMGQRFIEPRVPAEETTIINALRRGLGSIPRMPMGGPFMKADQIDEIARWIDAGMPE